MISRKLSWSLGLALLLCAGPILGQGGGSGVLIDEDFSSGFIDPEIFEPIGEGVELELDPDTGQLKVHVKNTGEGLRINIPQDLPGDPTARCMHLRQDIARHEFPRGFGWVHVIHMENSNDPTDVVTMELRAVRSFWNRCMYKLRSATGTTVNTGFLRPADGASAKWPCPEPKDVAFDWLPPAEPGGPEQIQIEVSAAAAGDCKFMTTKPTEIQHDPGSGGPPPTKPYRITKWEIVPKEEKPKVEGG